MMSAQVQTDVHEHVPLRVLLATEEPPSDGACPRCDALAKTCRDDNTVNRLGRMRPTKWSAARKLFASTPAKLDYLHELLDDDRRTFGCWENRPWPSADFDLKGNADNQLGYLGFTRANDGDIKGVIEAVEVITPDGDFTHFSSLADISGDDLIPITGLLPPESAAKMVEKDACMVEDLAVRLSKNLPAKKDELKQVVEWARAAKSHVDPDDKPQVNEVLDKIVAKYAADAVSATFGGIVESYGSLVADSADITQQQFSDFIWSENLRLNKLISNLYLKLAMTDLPDEDLFGSVCHSVAEYFHCDGVSLFLRHHEEFALEASGGGIERTLQLYGAFGAWDRALKSPFVRRSEPIAYAIPEQPAQSGTGNTLFFYGQLDPRSLPHRFAIRHGDGKTRHRSEQAVPHQLAWLNRNLGTTCRNILGASLRHVGDQSGPAHGIIRLENRRPRHLPMFRDSSREPMILADLWEVLALRPYVRYLLNYRPGRNHLNNEVGWRRMYEELAADVTLFPLLRDRWYDDRDDKEKRTNLLADLKLLKEGLAPLIAVVITAETLFQHIRSALEPTKATDSGTSNCPSFFNLVNIDAAWRAVNDPANEPLTKLKDRLQVTLRDGLTAALSSSVSQGGNTDETIVESLRREFYSCLNWPGAINTVDDLLTKCRVAKSSNLDGLDLEKPLCFLLQVMLQVCDKLEWCGRKALDEAFSKLLPEQVRDQYRGLVRCARAVQERMTPYDFEKPRGALDYNTEKIRRQLEDKNQEGGPNTRSDFLNFLGALVSDVLADAAMHSHTFGQVDEARLLFISRRVLNLMSSRIVALGQRCDVPVNHKHVSDLRLDDYAIEKFTDIRTAVTRVGLLVKRTLEYWQLKHKPDETCPTFLTVGLDLFDLIDQSAGSGGCFELVHVGSSKAIHEPDQLAEDLKRAGIPLEPQDGVIRLQMTAGGEEGRDQLHHGIRVEFELPTREAAKQARWLYDLHHAAEQLGDNLRELLLVWEREEKSDPETADPDSAVHAEPAGVEEAPATDPQQPGGPTNESDGQSRLSKLRNALDELISFSSKSADLKDLEFLENAREPLKKLCGEIGRLVNADTVAMFLEELVDSDRTMKMQAAVGTLEKTLREYKSLVDATSDPPKGVVYDDRWELIREDIAAVLKGGRAELLERMESQAWSLTNRIWHQGVGRKANSRSEMSFIRNDGQEVRETSGQGDDIAYPPERPRSVLGKDPKNWTLKNVVRTFLGIPIFARGGRTDCPPQLQPKAGNDALRKEFLLQHRVLGILKLEGKQPARDKSGQIARLTQEWWEYTRTNYLANRPHWSTMPFEKASEELDRLFSADQDDDDKKLGFELISDENECIDEKLIDYLTESLDARWVAEDVELLVSIAMEIGRLLTLRTLNYATQNAVFFTENDIGVLNVHHDDIPDVAAAHRAAEAVARKVRFELEYLRSDLGIERERRWAGGRMSGAVTHDPIREISHRCKDVRSLATKLVQRELARPMDLTAQPTPRLDFRSAGTSFSFDGPSPSKLTAKRLKGTAHWEFALRLTDDTQPRSWSADSVSGSLHCAGQRLKRAVDKKEDSTAAKHRPLVERILAPDGFGVEDWAGVRIKCGFLSDIFLVVDAVRSRFAQRNVEIADLDVESWLEQPQSDGYRGVHFVVWVPLKGLIPQKDYGLIARALGHLEDGDDVRFPCEIQIRTEYESSWAWASHFLQYKNRQVRLDLQGYMGALSGLLYESDKIMDLIRQYLEAEDVNLVEVLAELRHYLPEQAFAMVQFGVEFARHLHENHRLYGGRPHFERLVGVTARLVRDFHATDPYILLCGLLIDMWMEDAGPGESDVVLEFRGRIERACHGTYLGLLERLSCRLPTELSGSKSCDAYAEPVPAWFWAVLEIRRDYAHQGSAEDALARLDHLKSILAKRHAGDDETELRCYVLEAAIQLSRLQELPHEPLRSRAIEELEMIYHVLETIRSEIGTEFRNVWRQAERELREAADRLDTHLPIDWQS